MKRVDQIELDGRPPIVLTSTDRETLIALLHDCKSALEPESARLLREEVERADVAPEGSSNMMVGLGSEVKFIDHKAGRVRVRQLVLPHQVAGSNQISVLSPIGSALIGLGPGQSITMVNGGTKYVLTVLEVRRSGCLQAS